MGVWGRDVSESRGSLQILITEEGGHDRQNNGFPKDIHVLIPKTCEYATFI